MAQQSMGGMAPQQMPQQQVMPQQPMQQQPQQQGVTTPQQTPPQPQTPAQPSQSKDVNTAMLCRLGQETVHDIVSRTQELFNALKAIQVRIKISILMCKFVCLLFCCTHYCVFAINYYYYFVIFKKNNASINGHKILNK